MTPTLFCFLDLGPSKLDESCRNAYNCLSCAHCCGTSHWKINFHYTITNMSSIYRCMIATSLYYVATVTQQETSLQLHNMTPFLWWWDTVDFFIAGRHCPKNSRAKPFQGEEWQTKCKHSICTPIRSKMEICISQEELQWKKCYVVFDRFLRIVQYNGSEDGRPLIIL